MTTRVPRKGRPRRKSRSKRGTRWIALLVVCVLLGGVGYLLYSYGKGSLPRRLPVVLPSQEISVALYFGDTQSDFLVGERRRIKKRGDVAQQLEDVLLELIKGPRGDLIRTVPPQAVLQEVRVDERGLASLSFSRELSSQHPGGSLSEILTVYSIVDTVTLNFPQVTRVQLLMDGKNFETLAGHIDCSRPLGANRGLIKKNMPS